MVECLQCPPRGTGWADSSHIIESVAYNPKVQEGDTYTVKTLISRSWLGSPNVRVCLSEGGAPIGNSGSVYLGLDEIKEIIFTGIMPDRDLNLHVSLQMESFGISEDCKDGKLFTVYLAEDWENTEPPVDPDEPDVQDPTVSVGNWFPSLSLTDELEEYLPYIAVGVSILILIFITMRKQ